MPSAVALDAFDTGIQPSAVTLLAGDRYFFSHGSSFQPRRISHIAQLRSTPALGVLPLLASTALVTVRAEAPLSRILTLRF